MKYSTFELKNPITHPFFFWPETLVSFAADDAIPAVQDKNGKRYNCQTYEGKIHFLSGLNCGEHKIFTPAEDGTETKIRYREVEDFIIVDNHKFKLKIPKSRRLSSMDSSVFLFETASDFHAAARLRQCSFQLLETEILAKGDVFFKVRLSVKNADSSYSMVITVVYDYDFVSVDENMRNMEGSCLEISTEDLLPEHWHATTWPDDYWERRSDKYGDYDWKSTREPFVIPFNGEDPAFFNIPDDPDAFQVRLGAYVPFFAYSVRPCASFWNQNGASLGFFITNHANWDEGDYTIWGSSERIDGRFYYKKDVFTAKFALNGNSRSFGMAIYHRDLDERWFKTLEQLKEEAVKYGISEEEAVKLTCFPTTYTAFLHNRYAVLNLNEVKQWQLEYEDTLAPIPYDEKKAKIKSADELKRLVYSMGRAAIATKGIEEFHERPYTFEAVEIRMFYEKLIDAYVHFKDSLSPEHEKNITAMILISIYVCAGESCMPVRKMLGGHPNFLADIKSVAGIGAALFPKHRDAAYFAEVFGEYVRQNTRCHVRPAVLKWNARGGRWTESPGIYTWAFLTPTILANHLIKKFYDGRDRMCNPYLAQLARWLINYTTPPVEGKRRCLPIGAHSSLRVPYTILELLGDSLKETFPDVAANIEYLTSREERHLENFKNENDIWEFLYKPNKGEGKQPVLTSAKYTGCGLIFRQRVGAPDETAVFLQQVDDGPNYRWGLSAQGSCGALYYYADGKAYTHSGKEDTGDRKSEDTAYMTNFGVWKDGMYKSVGRNELSEPMYDLGFLQYGKILSSEEYSAPEYRYRSVMLLDHFFVIYDSVFSEWVHTRFSWFCDKNAEFPEFHFSRGYTPDRFAVTNYSYSEHITAETKGRWYEGKGTSMCIVSPKKLKIEDSAWGATVNGNEHIFMLDKERKVCYDGVTIRALAGYAKTGENYRLSLVSDGEMEYRGTRLVCEHSGAALSVCEGGLSGVVCSQGNGAVRLCYEGREYQIVLRAETEKIEIVNGRLSRTKVENTYPVFPPCEDFCRNTIYTKGNLHY